MPGHKASIRWLPAMWEMRSTVCGSVTADCAETGVTVARDRTRLSTIQDFADNGVATQKQQAFLQKAGGEDEE